MNKPATKKLLVVEDDAGMRELLADVLNRAGFQMAFAETGEAALEAARRDTFDLVLLDVWLPGMNGIDVLAELRRMGVTARVIVMTGDNTPETLMRAVEQQAYRCLAKPFTPTALLEMIQHAFEAPAEEMPIEVVSARPDWVELLVPCQFEAAERIVNFLTQLRANLPEEARRTLGQAFREMLLNAVEWGGKLDPQRKVRVACLRLKRMILYRIADPGPGFRVAELHHSALQNPPDKPFEHMVEREKRGLRPGGFGILVAQAMVDELLYNEAQNEVVLIKYLNDDAPAEEPAAPPA